MKFYPPKDNLKLYTINLPKGIPFPRLVSYLEQFGILKELTLVNSKHLRKISRYASFEYEFEETMKELGEKKDCEFDGKLLEIYYVRSETELYVKIEKTRRSRIYIKRVQTFISDEIIQKIFEVHGEVECVYSLVREPDRKEGTRSAFVVFVSEDCIEKIPKKVIFFDMILNWSSYYTSRNRKRKQGNTINQSQNQTVKKQLGDGLSEEKKPINDQQNEVDQHKNISGQEEKSCSFKKKVSEKEEMEEGRERQLNIKLDFEPQRDDSSSLKNFKGEEAHIGKNPPPKTNKTIGISENQDHASKDKPKKQKKNMNTGLNTLLMSDPSGIQVEEPTLEQGEKRNMLKQEYNNSASNNLVSENGQIKDILDVKNSQNDQDPNTETYKQKENNLLRPSVQKQSLFLRKKDSSSKYPVIYCDEEKNAQSKNLNPTLKVGDDQGSVDDQVDSVFEGGEDPEMLNLSQMEISSKDCDQSFWNDLDKESSLYMMSNSAIPPLIINRLADEDLLGLSFQLQSEKKKKEPPKKLAAEDLPELNKDKKEGKEDIKQDKAVKMEKEKEKMQIREDHVRPTEKNYYNANPKHKPYTLHVEKNLKFLRGNISKLISCPKKASQGLIIR